MLSLTINPLPSDSAGNSATNNAFFSSNDGPSFKDMLDIINPLQQIPIVGTIYRAMTGDTISAASKLAGGALYGGPLGFMASLADEIVQTQTGQDVGSNLLSWAQGNNSGANYAVADSGSSSADSSMPLGANQRAAYNAYLHTQDLTA
jgi:hypothetical protein